MRFDLVRPCPKCPFRTDVPPYLRGERAQEIARSLASGAVFACHQTTVDVDDPDGLGADRAEGPDSRFCAGALITLERAEAPNQIMRIAERTGSYDPARLDMAAPVARSLVEFVDHHAGPEADESEPCSVADAGCLAPAGYLEGGVAVRNVAIDPADLIACADCGELVCTACATASGRCPACEEAP